MLTLEQLELGDQRDKAGAEIRPVLELVEELTMVKEHVCEHTRESSRNRLEELL